MIKIEVSAADALNLIRFMDRAFMSNDLALTTDMSGAMRVVLSQIEAAFVNRVTETVNPAATVTFEGKEFPALNGDTKALIRFCVSEERSGNVANHSNSAFIQAIKSYRSPSYDIISLREAKEICAMYRDEVRGLSL